MLWSLLTGPLSVGMMYASQYHLCQELDGSGLLDVSEAVMLEVKCQWY